MTTQSASRTVALVIIGLAGAATAGCTGSQAPPAPLAAAPDYGRPLPDGARALRRVTDPDRMPDLGAAWRNRDVFLLEAIDQSLIWFAAPSSRQFFPLDGVTHEQAAASVRAFGDLVEHAPDESAFVGELRRMFDVYESVGWDGSGTVLFTGYYAPNFEASLERTSRFTCPLYRRPADLVTAPVTGEPMGRQLPDGRIVPYQTRREIEAGNLLAGTELVWLEDELSAYIIHVNGSAKLRLTDGTTLYIGYNGKTDHPYTGLGASLLEAGLLSRDELGLPAIKRLYREQPDAVREQILKNDNYVFFTEYEGRNWPAGSLGVRVTPETTLATDKRIYPRGGVLVVDTRAITFSRGRRPFLRFMLDQDTGGALRAPGRADIFMGIGRGAEILAGGQYAEGRLFYLFLKPEFVPRYAAPAAQAAQGPGGPTAG
ncbi:MAG: MltA domain-containing protein [Planctomycetota bacterium]|jgi:membrane-bound lytic murein transglycosylase A